MKTSGLNSWRSWIIAVASCVVYCLLVIVYRMSALFYVALIDQYNLDRKGASIPFVVLGFVRCLSGLIFGVLAERFGVQRITFLGCYMSTLGVGASFFTSDIISLSVSLGLFYGFGMTATALLPNIIRDHFDDTAISISNGLLNIGPCLAAVVFPGLIMHLIEEYGVSGSFLLSAGVILNAAPLIMILKPRNKSKKLHNKTSKENKNCNKQDNNSKDLNEIGNQNIFLDDTVNSTSINDNGRNENSIRNNPLGDKASRVKITSSFVIKQMPKCSLHGQERCPCIDLSSIDNKYDVQNFSDQHKIATNIPESKIFPSKEQNTICQEDNNETKPKKKGFFYTLNVLKDPTFMALTLVQGLFAYTFNIWLTTMIDYSRDKGIDRSYEIYILTLNPITDIVGRVALSWVTDKNYLSVPNFSALTHIVLTVSIICMVLAKDFAIMTLGILIMTFAMGVYLTICPRMSYSFIEEDKQAVSIASIGLLYAPLSFTVSPLIGYFRGKLGSYDGLYYMMAFMNFVCSLLVLLLPKLANMRERKKLQKC